MTSNEDSADLAECLGNATFPTMKHVLSSPPSPTGTLTLRDALRSAAVDPLFSALEVTCSHSTKCFISLVGGCAGGLMSMFHAGPEGLGSYIAISGSIAALLALPSGNGD